MQRVLLSIFLTCLISYPVVATDCNAKGLSFIKKSVVFVSSTTTKPDDVTHPVVHKGLGPGFIYDKKGHIVIESSSISDVHSIECSVGALGYWPAVILGKDPVTGIAVLEMKAPSRVLSALSPVSAQGRVVAGFGDHIFAIGVNPDGSPAIFPGTVSSALRPIGLLGGGVENLIQTTIYVHRGLDGAPVFTKSGSFIGMAVKTAEEPPPNVGFVLPSSVVKWVVDTIIENGRVTRAYLGAEVANVDSTLARLFNLPVEKGALVVRVTPSGPAANAGLMGCKKSLRLGNRLYPIGGDIIVAVDRIPVSSGKALMEILNQKGPGKTVLVSFYRDRRLRRTNVILGKR